jgi:hypothetical protein
MANFVLPRFSGFPMDPSISIGFARFWGFASFTSEISRLPIVLPGIQNFGNPSFPLGTLICHDNIAFFYHSG